MWYEKYNFVLYYKLLYSHYLSHKRHRLKNQPAERRLIKKRAFPLGEGEGLGAFIVSHFSTKFV